MKNLLIRYGYFVVLFISILMSGCVAQHEEPIKKPESVSLIKLLPEDYPDFKDDMNYKDIDASIRGSLSYLKRINSDREFGFGEDSYKASYLIESLETFADFIMKNSDAEKLNRFIRERYNVYQAAGRDTERNLLFTGYFEPLLKGSLRRTEDFTIPLYALPDDLIFVDLGDFSSELKGKRISGRVVGRKLAPYYERYDIEYKDAIFEKTKKIAWIKNRIDRFFLEIQGSGKVLLENGDILNVHYHASNGRKYRSIGSLLIKEGKVSREEMSMQKIYSYLEDNPDEVGRILSYNKSFVFFKLEKAGPIGCISVALTPMRSIATDRKMFPQASLAYIQTVRPVANTNNTEITGWKEMSGFVQNQDTGGAIKGAGRADFFWGNGDYAKLAAGHMKHTGKLFFLVLKKD